MSSSIYQRSKKFIRKSKKVHHNKYDYSKIDYVNAKTNVIICCPIHGDFEQTPDKHVNRKHGCPNCGGTLRSSTPEFIEKAKKVHGDTYEYMLANYKGSLERVQIVCHEHGVFKQTPKYHLRGHGCAKCGGHAPLTRNDFVMRSMKTHSNKYDYSLVEYTTDRIKVSIICPAHGKFEQSPNAHMNGQGCPRCKSYGMYSETIFEENEELKQSSGRLYLLQFTNINGGADFLKIGITRRSITTRFSSGYSNYEYVVLIDKKLEMYEAFVLEQHILRVFEHVKFTPNAPFAGRTECFTTDYTHQIIKTILTA